MALKTRSKTQFKQGIKNKYRLAAYYQRFKGVCTKIETNWTGTSKQQTEEASYKQQWSCHCQAQTEERKEEQRELCSVFVQCIEEEIFDTCFGSWFKSCWLLAISVSNHIYWTGSLFSAREKDIMNGLRKIDLMSGKKSQYIFYARFHVPQANMQLVLVH